MEVAAACLQDGEALCNEGAWLGVCAPAAQQRRGWRKGSSGRVGLRACGGQAVAGQVSARAKGSGQAARLVIFGRDIEAGAR